MASPKHNLEIRTGDVSILIFHLYPVLIVIIMISPLNLISTINFDTEMWVIYDFYITVMCGNEWHLQNAIHRGDTGT